METSSRDGEEFLTATKMEGAGLFLPPPGYSLPEEELEQMEADEYDNAEAQFKPRVNYLQPAGGVHDREIMEAVIHGGEGVLFSAMLLQTRMNRQLLKVPENRKGEVEALLALCVQREMSELLETLPETRLWRRKSGEHSNHEHTAEEFVDVILFLVNMMLVSGISVPDLEMAFLAKVEVLRERFGHETE